MLKKIEDLNEILVAIDFSDSSSIAFRHACLFAREFSANVTVFHSCGTYGQEISDYAIEYLQTLHSPDLPTLRKLAEKEMEKFLKENSAEGINIKTEIQEIGPVAQHILEAQEKLGADLLVIGTHGKKGMARWVLGNVAEKLLFNAVCPVLVVRDDPVSPNEKMEDHYKRLLIATDFSEHSEFAFSQGLQLAKNLNAQIDLAHVVDPHIFLPLRTIAVQSVLEEYQKEIRKEAKIKLKKYVEEHSDSKDFFESHVLNGNPAKEIIDACERFKSNLVIVGSHGHSRLSNLFLGSTAQRIAQKAPCPLLLIK